MGVDKRGEVSAKHLVKVHALLLQAKVGFH